MLQFEPRLALLINHMSLGKFWRLSAPCTKWANRSMSKKAVKNKYKNTCKTFSITLGTEQDPNKCEVRLFTIISLLCLLFHMGDSDDRVEEQKVYCYYMAIHHVSRESTEHREGSPRPKRDIIPSLRKCVLRFQSLSSLYIWLQPLATSTFPPCGQEGDHTLLRLQKAPFQRRELCRQSWDHRCPKPSTSSSLDTPWSPSSMLLSLQGTVPRLFHKPTWPLGLSQLQAPQPAWLKQKHHRTLSSTSAKMQGDQLSLTWSLLGRAHGGVVVFGGWSDRRVLFGRAINSRDSFSFTVCYGDWSLLS